MFEQERVMNDAAREIGKDQILLKPWAIVWNLDFILINHLKDFGLYIKRLFWLLYKEKTRMDTERQVGKVQ